MAHKVSPLAPERFPDLPPIAGVRLGTIAAGVRYAGRVDVMLAELAAGTTVAGVFTRSKTASAPVDWCRRSLPGGSARALIVNAGNANAFTGTAGLQAVEITAEGVAGRLGCRADEVFVASTGVIGEPLPAERITAVLDTLSADLQPDRWAEAARAIMTTDTYPKGVTATADIGGTTVTINGIIKGSGMIAPDMATMLGFVFTDAALPADVMQALLSRGSDRSFNCITVDSDTSTSDTVLLFATGKAGNPAIETAGDRRLAGFRRALDGVLMEMAHLVVKDGKVPRSWSRSGSVAPRRRRPPGASASPSPTHRWSRPPLPPATPTGAASSWRSASRARRPTATGWPSPWAASRWRVTASASTAMTRRRWRLTWPAARSRSTSMSASARPRRPSGPAI